MKRVCTVLGQGRCGENNLSTVLGQGRCGENSLSVVLGICQ